MLAVNYSTLRENMKDCFDQVAEDRETIIVTQKGENIVILSQSDYDSIMETLHLVREEANYNCLKESVTQYRCKKGQPHELIEADND